MIFASSYNPEPIRFINEDEKMTMATRTKQPGSGRAKGTPNKLTRTVKEVLLSVFNELQAMEGDAPKYPGVHMLEWALREPGEFYRIAARLIPTELAGGVAVNGGLAELLSSINDRVGKSSDA
jgi:hypothetical protein